MLVLAFLGWCIAASAQFTTTGTVTDKDNEALIGVTVVVKNTNNGTVTDLDGKYMLSVSGNSAVLVISYIGYKQTEIEVSSSSGAMTVVLEETNTMLDAVVVSGLATTVKRSNLANAVDQISAKQLTEITQQSTLDGALYGKFTGAQITSNSGSPGGGFGIRLRGLTSINGPAQPLFIVDGIIIDNSSIPAGLNVVSAAAAGGSTAQFEQDNASNRIADLDPGDIESIEILKGASAAAIYGSRASSGVVIITTKRGKANKAGEGANIELSQAVGFSTILNRLGTRDWDSEKVEASFGPDEVINFEEAQASGNLHDYEDELYGNTGLLSDTRLGISGGNERTTFYTSAAYKNETGIVPSTGYERLSLRVNLNHKISDMIDLALSTNYVQSSADRGYFNNDNTSTSMGVAFVSTPSWAQLQPDENGNYPDNPYSASNFLQTAALMTNNEKVNRFIGGGRITTKLLTTDQNSLRLILNGGMDQYSFNTTAIFPRELQFEKNGNGTNGASIQGNTGIKNYNLGAYLVHTYYANSGGLSLRSQLGVDHVNNDRNTIINTATELIGSQTNLDQAGAIDVYQYRSFEQAYGWLLQEELNLSDQIYITAGIRGDKSSNNGDANKYYYYPKASLAVNLGEFDFWNSADWNLAKIRIAYGQSGNFAEFGSKYTSLVSTNIGGTPGSIINNLQGNAEVAPERQEEIELGFDLGFLDNKITLEATYYIKTVTDLLLEAQTPESSGFTTRVTNAADLQNKGVEIALGIEAVRNDNFNWYTRPSFWMNRSEITRLDIPSYAVGAFGTTLATYYVDTNASATQIVGIVEDADYDPASGLPEGLGKIGDSEPDFQMAWYNELNYNKWSLTFNIHWKQGGDNINLSTLLSDIFGTSPDYDDTTLDPTGQLVNGDYRLQALGVTATPWVEDASYIRLREIGLYYTFDGGRMADNTNGFIRGLKVGLSGYNVLNFFDYNSYDPEVSNFGTNGISTGVEVTPFPTSKRFYAHVQLSF